MGVQKPSWGKDIDPEDFSAKFKYKDIRNLLQQLLHTQQEMPKLLAHYLAEQAAEANTFLHEGDRGQLDTTAGTYTFDAQTHDLEIITTILVRLPTTVTNPVLEFENGDITIPLVAGYTFLQDLQIPVIRTERLVTWGNPLTTDTISVLVLARPAPVNIPAILH